MNKTKPYPDVFENIKTIWLPDDSVGRVGVDVVLLEPSQELVVHPERDPGLHVLDVAVTIGAADLTFSHLLSKVN